MNYKNLNTIYCEQEGEDKKESERLREEKRLQKEKEESKNKEREEKIIIVEKDIEKE